MHSTNYTNAFIDVADDCKADVATVPPEKQEKTIARMQYELLHDNPYQFTSDDLIFTIHAARNQISEANRAAKRAEFFSKGQPCLRSSPLGKTYGWGIHANGEAKVALVARESQEYQRLKADTSLKQLKAMKRAR